MARLDHVVVAVSDLTAAEQRWARAGLPVSGGGEHPGGTLTAVVRGPEQAYLQLISAPPGARNHWSDRIRESPGPISLSIAVEDLDECRAALLEAGFKPAAVGWGSRIATDGQELVWRLCDVAPRPFDPEIPWLIQWITPENTGPADGPVLRRVRVSLPDPTRCVAMLRALGLPESSWTGGTSFVFGEQDDAQIEIVRGEVGIERVEFEVTDAAQAGEVTVDGLIVTKHPAAVAQKPE